jgi:L,D-peptidoglycan transpeptidase YkuD (ErfK/YbiS/YcfS/YnhG family)
MIDSLDDVIALAWESDDSDINFDIEKRLVFRYGEDEKKIKDKLYERDIVLEFDKQVVYEKE